MNRHFRWLVALACIGVLASCDNKPKETAVKQYKTVAECSADVATDASAADKAKVAADCQAAWDKAKEQQQATAPHYTTEADCLAIYPPGMCGYNTGGYYYPFMTGFMFGYLNGAYTYQPYYMNSWGFAYSGRTTLGYYRGGYIMASPSAAWHSNYTSVTINRGSAPPPVSSVRGGFGGTVAAGGRGFSGPSSVSSPRSGGGGSISSGSSGSARGGFGGFASSGASSGG